MKRAITFFFRKEFFSKTIQNPCFKIVITPKSEFFRYFWGSDSLTFHHLTWDASPPFRNRGEVQIWWWTLKKIPNLSWLPPRSLTARPWKMVVGRLLSYWVLVTFQGWTVKLRGCMLAKYGKMTSWEVSNNPFHKGIPGIQTTYPNPTTMHSLLFWFEKKNSWIDDKFWTLQSILNKTKRKKTQQTKNTKHNPLQKKINPSTQESKQIKIIQKAKPNWNNLKQKPAFKHQKSRLRFVCFSKLL